MIVKKIQKNSGFVILFAVTLSSILLAMALGIANISLKEIKFSTSAETTNEAFFAADTAIEYILYKDRSGSSIYTPDPGTEASWPVTLTGIGNTGASCAKATITKDNTDTAIPTITTIISRGYNIGDTNCNSNDPNRVEREIEVNY